MARIGTGMELNVTIFRYEEKMDITKLSMNEVPTSIGITKLHTAPKTTLALELPTTASNSTVQGTPTFRMVAVLKISPRFVCIPRGHSAARKYSRILFGPTPEGKELLTGCILLAMRTTVMDML